MIHRSVVSFVALGTIFAVLAGSVSIVAARQAPSPKPTASIESGRVIGTTANGINEFLGIPYALPPVGARRWMPPEPYKRFPGGVHQATKFGSKCAQPGSIGKENCLFLNVYTPESESSTTELAVMVWIHGGGLVTGGGDDYDVPRLVQQGVIVVTINYRLGYLGFFAQSAIDAEKHLKGNYGLMDQQLALNWVHDNIAAFGGDPKRVTIFGESAGGQSVYANMASPTAAQLFQGAISQSGSYGEFQDYFDFIVPLAAGETSGTSLVPSGSSIASSVKCSNQTAKCLRRVAASKLVAKEPATIYPFIDGTLLMQTPSAAFASGRFNRVPVISGTNHDEYRYFVAIQYDFGVGPLTDTEYPTAVAALEQQPVGSTFVQFLLNTQYPLSDFPPPTGVMSAPLALGALGTDDLFACPVRSADLALAQAVPTYAYEFNDETAPSTLPPVSFPLGDAHTIELQYLFGENPQLFLTPDQIELSDRMIGYWTQFAKTGNPNSPGAPIWPQYSAGGTFESLVAPTPETRSDTSFDSDHRCSSFWDTF
jgi:para-nitrobenzyl esterase